MATATMTRAAAALLLLLLVLLFVAAPVSSCDDVQPTIGSCRSFFAGKSQARGGCCDVDCLCKLWSDEDQYALLFESSIRRVCGLELHNCD